MLYRFLPLLLVTLTSWSAWASICADLPVASNASATRRARLVCDLKDALENKYVGLNYKRAALGVDVGFLMEECAQIELNTQSGPFEDLDFEDRVRQCLSFLRDRHISVAGHTETPTVTVGIGLIQIGDRFYVSWTNSRLLALSQSNVPLGAEVTHVNDQLLVKEVSRLESFIGAGSLAGRRRLAVQALTERDFSLPRTATLKLTFAGSPATSITLPWWALGPNQREDTRELFKKANIRSTASRDPELYGRYSDRLDFAGYRDDLPLTQKTMLSLFDDQLKPGLRFGVIDQQGKEFCYLQLLTFKTSRWLTSKSDSGSFPFADVFPALLHQCKQRSLPLVIDLRFNLGGNPNHPEKLAALLAKPNESIPPLLMTMPVNNHSIRVLNKLYLGDGIPLPPEQMFLITNAYRNLEKARTERKGFLDFVPHRNIVANSAETAFSNPIYILTGLNCMSACERFVSMLQNTGRATVMGHPTDGTSSGSWTFGPTPAAEWRDDKFDTLIVQIPNAFYAVLDRPLRENEFSVPFESNRNLLKENRPISVSDGFSYQTQLVDVLNGNQGWLDRISRALSQ